MAPVFSHGDLRLYLLSLLDESPRHGYDLMQALSDRTGGMWRRGPKTGGVMGWIGCKLSLVEV